MSTPSPVAPAHSYPRPTWRIVHDPEELHQYRGYMAVLGACGPSQQKPDKFWWGVNGTPVTERTETNYCDTLEEAKAHVEKWLEPYIAYMDGRAEYRSEKGIAQFWSKDGMWHIARPVGGGFRYTDEQFNSRQEAIAAIEEVKP